MAILNRYEYTNTGLVLEQAYYKARKEVDIKGDMAIFSCDIYYSKQAREDGKNPLASIEYRIPTVGGMALDENTRTTQEYALLKTLPEFENSIDI